MLVYCLNNPVNCFDNTGKDAIWIQEGGSAYTMGHSGLLVQDSNGNWCYFYWGPADSEADIFTMIGGTPAVCILEEVDITGLNLHESRTRKQLFILFKQNSNKYEGTFFGNQCSQITEVKYFYGDYSATFEFLVNLKSKVDAEGATYKLLEINCCQVSCEAMGQSDERFNLILPVALVPNIAYSEFISGFRPWPKRTKIIWEAAML